MASLLQSNCRNQHTPSYRSDALPVPSQQRHNTEGKAVGLTTNLYIYLCVVVLSLLCSNIPAVAQAYITPALMTGDTADIGGDVCPRCTKQVFIAEKRQAAGKVSHAA